MTPERLRVAVGETSVTALLHAAPAERLGIALVLAHGAGAGQASPFMTDFARGLAARGIDVVTFDFLYTEQRRRLPDANDKLEACWRGVIDAVRARAVAPLVIGGKSMGGRIASQVAAAGAGPLAGLVLLGYPLHPPGKPERLRAAHLPAITAPMLFVQGERDAFGTPEELRPVLATLRAPVELHVVAGGDHSFKVPKQAAAEVHDAVQDHIAQWLRRMTRNGAQKT